MSLLDRDDVPEPKSLASTRPTLRPRVTASSAAARSAGPSLVVARAGLCGAPPPFPAWRLVAARAPAQTRLRSARRGTGGHHDLHSLEFLEVGVARSGHRAAERAHQVHGSVGDGR